MISELIVIATLQEQGFELLHHRKHIQKTEIDLIFKSQKQNKQILFVEVKSVSKSKDYLQQRWPYKQKQQFQYLLNQLNYKYKDLEIVGLFALVSLTRVEFYSLDEV